jgi:hypothetical protein
MLAFEQNVFVFKSAFEKHIFISLFLCLSSFFGGAGILGITVLSYLFSEHSFI